MRTSTEFITELDFCSYNFLMYRFSRSVKGKIDVYRLCPNIVQITMCFFVTPRHRCVIMHEVDAYKDRF